MANERLLNSNQRAMVHAAEAHLGFELSPIQLCLARLEDRDQMTIANRTKIAKVSNTEFTMLYSNELALRVDATRGLTFYFSDIHESNAFGRRMNDLMPRLLVHRANAGGVPYTHDIPIVNVYVGYTTMIVRIMHSQVLNNGRPWNNWTTVKEMKWGDTLFIPWTDINKNATDYLRINKLQTVAQVAANKKKKKEEEAAK